MKDLPLGLRLAILAAIAIPAFAFIRCFIEIRELHERLDEVEVVVDHNAAAPAPTPSSNFDWTPWLRRFTDVDNQLSHCEARTNDLRAVLETLIKVGRWPGYDRLPRPVSDWAPWPKWGIETGDVKDMSKIPQHWDGKPLPGDAPQ